jgi:hypothetical protein
VCDSRLRAQQSRMMTESKPTLCASCRDSEGISNWNLEDSHITDARSHGVIVA